MRVTIGQNVGELMPQSSGGHAGDEGVPRPMEYASYSETFWVRIFRRLAAADAANAQSAGRMAEMREDLRNALNDINVLRQNNQDLRDESVRRESRVDVLQLQMEEMKLRTEINHEEMQRLKRDSAEQRDGHEALLGLVRANSCSRPDG